MNVICQLVFLIEATDQQNQFNYHKGHHNYVRIDPRSQLSSPTVAATRTDARADHRRRARAD